MGLLLSGTLAVAAPSSVAPAQSALVHEIDANRDPDFTRLLAQWTVQYGTVAVQPLLSIANDHRNSDRQRYVAIMGAAKLGGPANAQKIAPFLKDKVWMIRTAALRALTALRDPKTAKLVLPLLKDPALVVRAEAVESVKVLRPEGAVPALIAVLHSQDNYHFGKAQWVPERALAALVVLNDRSIVPQLRPLLDHRKDPELQRQTVFALQTLTGIELNPNGPLEAQVENWKKTLAVGHMPVVTSSAHSESKPLR